MPPFSNFSRFYSNKDNDYVCDHEGHYVDIVLFYYYLKYLNVAVTKFMVGVTVIWMFTWCLQWIWELVYCCWNMSLSYPDSYHKYYQTICTTARQILSLRETRWVVDAYIYITIIHPLIRFYVRFTCWHALDGVQKIDFQANLSLAWSLLTLLSINF